MSGQIFTGFWMSPIKNTRAQNKARLWMCKGYTGYWICLTNTSICLKHTWINRVLNMPEFWMCLMQYIVCSTQYMMQSLYKLLSNYPNRCILRHCQTFKIERFAKTIVPECRHTIRKFSWQSTFCGTWALR